LKVGLACGARAVGAKGEILCIIPLLMEVFRDHEHPFYITSITDGEHGIDSLHRFGLAIDIDFREDQFGLDAGEWLAEDIRSALGPDYDVVFEHNHVHVEFDPKTQPIVNVAQD